MLHTSIPEFNFGPKVIGINSFKLRILAIEGITGLKNIDSAFDDPLNNTEIELLVSYLKRSYNFTDGENNVFSFILNVIKFSSTALESINANYEEFFDNMTVEEAI